MWRTSTPAYFEKVLEVIGIKLTATDYKKSRRRERLKNKAVYKLHLKYLSSIGSLYFPPVVPMDIHGNYVWRDNIEVSAAYYRCFSRGNTFYKNHSNRVVRNYNGEIHRGGSYKKYFDYWWTID